MQLLRARCVEQLGTMRLPLTLLLQRVRKYLIGHGVVDGQGIVFNPNGRHGEAILTNSSQIEDLFAWLGDNPPATKFT